MEPVQNINEIIVGNTYCYKIGSESLVEFTITDIDAVKVKNNLIRHVTLDATDNNDLGRALRLTALCVPYAKSIWVKHCVNGRDMVGILHVPHVVAPVLK